MAESGAPDAAAAAIDLVRGAFLQDERDAPLLLAARDRIRRQLASVVESAGTALERSGRAESAARLRAEASRRDPGLATPSS